MNEDELKTLLEKVRNQNITLEEAFQALKDLPYEDVGFAKIDHHRGLRVGFPEVVFCQGKLPAQVLTIVSRLLAHNSPVIATRADPDLYELIRARFPQAKYHEPARIISLNTVEAKGNSPLIAVLSAGTADIPVAEEAAVTAELLGSRVMRAYDVGVAGLHRLLDKRRELTKAQVKIVVAGMDGALPSVVGGLFGKPVVAVPTSVGYGASLNGLAALLTMLNSCAVGVGVVNIDNGFGAGVLANMILRAGTEAEA
jgi:NCAIR mutase (PurE)-related protein